jgi:lipoprotein-anchoring transpeptidase ErfK/SrfK
MGAFRRWGLRLLALPLAFALAGVAAPSAGTVSRVPAGVSIGGLPLGGFSSEEARALVREALAQPLAFELDGDAWTATAAQLGVSAAVDDAVAAALHAQPGTDVEAGAVGADAALRKYVRGLGRRLDRDPQDARVEGVDGGLRPIIVPEVKGRAVDVEATLAVMRRAIASAAREPVRPVFRPVAAKRTAARFGPVIVIRRGSNMLTLYNGRKVVRVFGVATGAPEFPTPLGTFAVVDKQYNPWWYPPASDWAKDLDPIPPGPGNPLGTRWMGLNVYGVGIHGTPNPASIGYSASHGCIRMRIWEAEWLFEQVQHGTPVVIVSA